MENWVTVKDTQFPNNCDTCQKHFPAGSNGWLSRHGAINQKTGMPRWVFRCKSCHEVVGTDEPVIQEIDHAVDEEALQETLAAIAEVSGDSATDAAGSKPVHEPYSLPWIKENATWGA